MNRLLSLTLAAVTLQLCSVSGSVVAQTESISQQPAAESNPDQLTGSLPARLGENAALYYWRAWSTFPDDLQLLAGAALDDPDFDWAVESDLSRLLQGDDAMQAVIRASQIVPCDFGVAYDDGFMSLLPHLTKMRSTAQVLRCDAKRLWANGLHDKAYSRIASMLRIGEHAGHDRILISSLVSMAIVEMGQDELDAMLARQPPDKDVCQELAGAFARFEAVDTFSVRRAVAQEKRMTGQWLKAQHTGPNAGALFVRTMNQLVDGKRLELALFVAMSEQALHQQIDESLVYFDDVLAAWDQPDAVEEMKRLAQRVEEGDYGLVAKLLAPALGHVQPRDMEASARVRESTTTINALCETLEKQPAKTP